MPKWTTEQQTAIDERHKNLLVSAAAGSGKTAVLIERIVGLIIDDEIPIDTFLIVTYTNAAAGEMRERLLKKIMEKLEDMPDNQFLKNQVNQLGAAQISTIHSFCITVVRTYFYKVSLDPTFKMGDSYDLELLREEAINDVFEKEYFLEAEDFIELVESYSGNRGDTGLREMVLKVYDFILSKPAPFEWLETVIKRYDVGEDTNYWIERYIDDIKGQLEDGKALLLNCLPLCQVEDGPEEYLAAIESDLSGVEDLLKRLDNSLDSYNEGLLLYKSQRLKTIGKARKEIVDKDLQDEVKGLRALYKDKVIKPLQKSAIHKDEQGLISEFVVLHRRLGTILRLVESFKLAYQTLKLEKNLLDFSDLEHYTIELLKDEGVRQSLNKKFEYIFVDEYQDANEIQEAIIQGICREDNLFMVGDVKQSIYKFRLADPSIFLSKMSLFKEGGINKRIDLSKNFRSRASVLEGINEIFKRLMSKTFGEIEYDAAASLYPGREDANENNHPVEVQLLINEEEDSTDDQINDLKNIEKEAHYIAKRIHRLQSEDKYDFEDMVILLRGAKTDGPIMAEIFATYGIPTYLEAGGEYFEAIEVKMLLSLLHIVDNVEQDIPLLTVLRSPIGAFTTEELAVIRDCNKKITYYEALQSYMMDNDNVLSEKIRAFVLKIEAWSNRSKIESLEGLIWEMVHNNAFLSFIESLPEGGRRLKNIEVLIDKVSQLQTLGGLSLFKLISVLEKIEEFSVDMGGQGIVQQDKSTVKIMTIHKSKGLEFPVVFLAGTNKRFNLRDAQGHLLMHKDHGLGLKYVDPWKRLTTKSVPQLVIKQRILEENLAEEMRVLYVAMTRAVDRLIITGVVKKIEQSEKKWHIGDSLFNLKRATGYLDWIMMILQSESINKAYFKVEQQSMTDVFTENRLSSQSKDSILSLLSNHEISNEVKNGYKTLETMDAYSEEETLPAKVSVSSLKRMAQSTSSSYQQPLPNLVKLPKFLQDMSELAPEERGTLIHHLFRHIDYNKVSSFDALKGQIQALAKKGIAQTEGLNDRDYKKMMSFIDSSIGQRLIKSNKIKRETPFVVKKKIDGAEVLVQGIIDLYFEESDSIVLLDFKTDRIGKEKLEERSQQYHQQLSLYAEAIEKITGKAVTERYLYFLELGIANKL